MESVANDLEISIDFKDVLGLGKFLSSSTNRILVIDTCDPKLELVRIFNIFQQLRKVYQNEYLGAEDVSNINWTQLKNRLSESEDGNILSKSPNLTIIDVLNNKLVDKEPKVTLNKLFECASKTELKKVILVSSLNRICLKCAGIVDKYDLNFSLQKKITNICFQDLTEETQHNVVSRPSICFQGKLMSLREFLDRHHMDDESLNNIVTSAVLNNITFLPKINSFIEIGSNTTSGKTKDLYIERRFQNSFLIINRIKKLLTSKSEIPDVFVFSGLNDKHELVDILKIPKKNSHIILNNENVLVIKNQEEAIQFFNIQASLPAVHLITYEQNHVLTWTASKGSLDRLRKFSIRNTNLTSTIEHLLKKKAVVLTGPCGTGKSTTLEIVRAHLQSSWTINIDFSRNRNMIDRIDGRIDQQKVLEFLSNCIGQNFLAIGLLNYYLFNASNVPVYILVDGFEEIAENLDLPSYRYFIELLRFLKDKSQAHVWITALTENCTDLENALSEFSTQFDKITVEEQNDILYRHCKSKFTVQPEEEDSLRRYVSEFYKHYKTVLINKPAYLGLPFVLKILWDMAHRHFKSFADVSSNTLVKYENVCEVIGKFIEFKIHKYMQDYFSNNNHKEEITNYLNAIHGVVASRLLCSELDQLLGGRNDIVFHVDISKVGFVSAIGYNTFQFVHRTFAEYFAAGMFYKWTLDPKAPMEQILLFKILLEPQYKILRLFLNQRIKEHPPPVMPNNVIERLVDLWDHQRTNFLNTKGECALHVLINEHLSNLAQWFFPKDFMVYILPLFSTRCKFVASHLFNKIENYKLAANIITNNLPIKNDDLSNNLITAVSSNKLDDVKSLLCSVKDVVARTYVSTSHSKSVLHLAASLGFKDIVEYLVEISIPVDILDSSNATPLQLASSSGHLDIVKFLKSKGSNINHRDSYLKTALFRCAEKGHMEIVKYLVDEDANKDALDKNGTSVLQQAVKSRQLDVVKLLLSKGLDVNHMDYFGLSALAWAVKTGDIAMVDLLMGAGADTTIKDQHGRNLVHIAVKTQHWQVVKYLTFCLIDANIPDGNNITPLERAIKLRKWDMVEHLILEGAHVQINDRNGFNPIGYTIEHNEWALALQMIKRGGSLIGIPLEKKEAILDKATDPNEDSYSSFSKVIELGNVELLEVLIQRKGLNDVSKSLELDRLLAEPYEELTLNKLNLLNEMKMFVEGKLVQLRSSLGQKLRLSDENVKEKIQFICEQIRILKTEYLRENYREVDEEFLVRARYIAQNIHLLKRAARNANIPWEQMEFCLVIFINFFLKPQHEDFVYRLVLDQERLIKYLDHFSNSLRSNLKNQDPVSEYLIYLNADYWVMKDIYSLNRISFYIKLALSITNYEDEIGPFVLMRCLQVIGESFKNTTDSPNLSGAVHNYLFLSAPTNVKRIVTSLRDSLSHSNTYKLKTETETTLKSNPDYFRTIQNDLRKIRLQIDLLLYTKKKETLQIFHTKCLESANNPNGLKNINRYVDWNSQDKATIEDYEIKDLNIIKELVHQLKQTMQDPNEKEQEMLDKLSKEIRYIEKTIYQRLNKVKQDYFTTRSSFKSLDKVQHSLFVNFPRIDFCVERRAGIYYNAVSILIDLLDFIQTKGNFNHDAASICSQLCYIMKWDAHKVNTIQEIDTNLTGKSENTSECIINDVFAKIRRHLENSDDIDSFNQYVSNKQKLHDELDRIRKDLQNSLPLIEQLNIDKKDKSNLKKSFHKKNFQVLNNIINNLDDYGKLIKSCSDGDKFYKILKGFCSRMHKNVIDKAIYTFIEEEENTFKDTFTDKFKTLAQIINENENKLNEHLTLRSAVEILLLDVMEACSTKEAIVEYVISFDEFTPLLVGTALRNYLAHGTPLIDILPFDHIKAMISTVTFLLENKSDLFLKSKEAPQYSCQDPWLNFQRCLNMLKKTKSEATLDGITSQDDLQRYQTLTQSRGHTFYECFLQAASTGALNFIKYVIKNLQSEKIINTTIIWPAIIIASKNGHENVVETLLNIMDTSIINNDIDEKINPFIFKIVRTFLTRHGVTLSILDSGNSDLLGKSSKHFLNTAFHLSVINGHHGIGKMLFKHHPNTDVIDKNGASVLHLAAEGGHEEVVNLLLNNQANVNAVRSDLTTPLHLAASNGHIGTVDMLLKHNASVDVQQRDQFTPLHLAVMNGHAQTCKLLLKHGATIDLLTQDQSTALHLAAQNNYVEVAEVLLAHNAHVNALDYKEITPIHLAVASGHDDIVRTLLEYNACLDKFDGELTPLHLAALYDQKIAAKLLLERKASVDAKYNKDLTPLHLASIGGSREVVEVLLDYCANIESTDDMGFSPLHFASQHGHLAIVKLLVKHQAKVNAVTASIITPLYLAASHGQEDVVKYLLENNANVNGADNIGRTPLHISFLHHCDAVVKILLENNADVNALTEDQATPLHFFAEDGQDSVVNMLIERAANVNARDKDLFTPLHLAAQNNHESVAKLLIENNAEINAMMLNQATPLHACADKGHLKLVKLLLENGADIEAITSNNSTPLHLSATNGHIEVVKELLKHKASIDAVTVNQSTPLHLSAISGHVAVAKILLEHHANVDAVSNVGTALHICALKGDVEFTQLLLDNNAKVNVTTNKQGTPLHLAVNNCHETVVKMLLKSGANVDTDYDHTPLHLAVQNARHEIVNLLLKYHANVNALTSEMATPLYLAAQNGLQELVKTLLKHKANIETGNKDLFTPLHVAAQRGHIAIVRDLLEHNATVNARSNSQVTPLHLSAANGYQNIVEILLQNHAEVDAAKTDQTTALHLAAKNGHLNVVNLLLENHANVNALRIRQSPLYTTPDNEFQFGTAFQRTDMTYILKETALTIAEQEGHGEIVSTLLDHGAINGLEYLENPNESKLTN